MNGKRNFKNLIVPIVVTFAFWGLGIWGFLGEQVEAYVDLEIQRMNRRLGIE